MFFKMSSARVSAMLFRGRCVKQQLNCTSDISDNDSSLFLLLRAYMSHVSKNIVMYKHFAFICLICTSQNKFHFCRMPLFSLSINAKLSLCTVIKALQNLDIPFTKKRTRLLKIAWVFTHSELRWIHTQTRTMQFDTIRVENYMLIDTEFP